jgi:type I restriction enzyme S subunit
LTAKQVSEFKETEIGKIPVDWEVKKLGDVFELSQGLQISSKKRISENKEGYLPLLKIRDLLTNKFSEFVSLDDVPLVYIASKEDIIYTRTGQVGLVYTNVEGCVHNNCFKIHYGDFDKMFVYYTLNQRRVFEYANAVAGGSVQKDLTHPAFKSCLITYPKNKQEQIRIGIFISNLDSKIQNLQNQNDTLEQMTQEIFQSWFVDFDGVTEWDDSELGKIPKKWRVTKLGEHTTIKGRIGWKGLTQSEYADIGYHLVTGRQIVNETVDWESCPRVSEERYLESPEIMLKKNDILMSKDGTIGRLSFIHELFFQASVGTGIFVIRSNSDYIDQYFLLAFFKSNIFKEIVKSRTEGSVIPHLYQRDIKDFNLALAPKPLIQKFSKIYERITQLQFSNSSQIEKLTKTRDALLPKLMSGEIRV